MGNTALHRAGEEGLQSVATILLDAGADPLRLNKDGTAAFPGSSHGAEDPPR